MIALLNNLPLVVQPSGDAIGFRKTWLRAALRRAAVRAGYRDWSLALDLCAAISVYLEKHLLVNAIELARLEDLVRHALCDVGYQDVAVVFGRTRRPSDAGQLELAV